MTDTTTIEITTAQLEDLKELRDRGNYNSLKGVIGDLLEDGNITVAGIDESEARKVAREVVSDMVTHKALQ